MGKAENLRKRVRCITTVVAGLVVFLATQGLAFAHIDPAGCTANNLSVNISKDKSQIISGETVHYQVTIANGGAGGCNIDATDVVFHCPAADGTPTGSNLTLTTTGAYPVSGAGDTCWNFDGAGGCVMDAGMACVVTLTTIPGQANARVNVGAIGDLTKGALHDSPSNSSFDASKDLGVTVVECLDNEDCSDGLFCTDDICDLQTNTCSNPPHSCPADSNLCTTESCDENLNQCVSSAPRDCNDMNICTDDSCVTATGLCSNVFDPTNDPSCAPSEFCRTPGFWGTHADADPDKACSQNITQAVLDAAPGGFIPICGELICNTLVDDASSAVEAICVRVQGQQTRQLARQLTAARLNCIVSGETGGPCNGISINAIFDACNTACAAGNLTVMIGPDEVDCIDALDCFNNGGVFDNASGFCATGICSTNGEPCTQSDLSNCVADTVPIECIPFPNNCHDADFGDFELPNDSLSPSDPCFEKQGPAGSSDECKGAHKTQCTVIQPNEAACDTENACD